MILGIDTASVAGLPDYSALYSQGARFIIPRCTMGLGVDKNAAHHARYAPREGLELLALYGWLDAALLGKAQAEHAFAVCETLDAPLFLDLEPPSKGPRPVDSPLYARKVAHDFLRRWFELAGVKAGIYGATSYIASLQLDPSLCGPLWGAIVGENGAPHPGPVPKVPPFASCAIHQFQHNVVVKSANEKPALIDWNRASHSVQELRVMLGATPNPYPSLGPVIDAVNGAMGIGRSVEDFVTHDEGPKVG